MNRSAYILFIALVSRAASLHSQTPAPPAPHHEANFEAERKQANDLYLAQKPLEALPLYEDLCRQDPTIAVFAERHGSGLIAKAGTLVEPKAIEATTQQAIAELRRAQALGDNSPYVQTVLGMQSKNLAGSILSDVPLTVGYTYAGNAQANPIFQQGEAAFNRADLNAALELYRQAAELDPAWYQAALDTGDTYFRMHDPANAGLWFGKAIAIDPDRETAYRYWGDTLLGAGDRNGARDKFVQAVVAEPYARSTLLALEAWAKRTGHQVVKPAISRPSFITPEGKLAIDPALAASTTDGRSSWIVYQQYRVDHGARVLDQVIIAGAGDASGHITPSGYKHTIAEEHAALRAMLADLDAKIKAGTLLESALDPNLRNIRALERENNLGAWIAINAADAGIRNDYPDYRAHHRQHLVHYVNGDLIRDTPPTAPAAPTA